MPNWNEILQEITDNNNSFDEVRRKYINQLFKLTGRNVIIYYSGWLQKPSIWDSRINDNDKNGFMSVIYNMDRTKGLDLILHTPGGEVAATESLIDYLHSMFNGDIRAFVPQLAMSAGTMIACACKEIVMGKHSSLGPIDPQLSGLAAHGIVEEFDKAYQEIKQDSAKIPVWQPILAKYSPTLIGECEKAIKWAEEIVTECLERSMFKDEPNADKKIAKIIKELGSHSVTKSHSRHLSIKKCADIGLNVVALEDDQDIQEIVLSIHHASMHTLGATPASKIIENHLGNAFIQMASQA